ncbi:MAG: serine/threonine protein kinase, partial [Planctomycetota bacterium]
MASVPSLNGRYHLWRVLSDGPGGRVYVASDSREPASPIVLKSFHGEDLGEGRRFYERLVFRTALRHPNLGAVLDFGRVKEIGAYTGPPPDGDGWENLEAFTPSIPPGLAPDLPSVYLTSPYLGGGNLADVSSRFLASAPSRSELDRWLSGISLQILEALRFLHEHSFLHFDVKPEHVLFDDGVEIVSGIQHATLIDLGLSARESTPLGNRVRGTFPYMAPEVLKNSMVDPRADIYSFGATLYHALTGGVLIESHGREKLQAMVDQGRFPAPADLLPSLPEGWSELILRLLSPDPAARPRNAAELIHEISGRPAAVALAERAQGGITWEPPRLTGLEREFDYVHREIEKLQLGETGSPLILLGGAQGVGRHAVANRLCDLARVEGVEIFRVHCCGPGVPPLAPLGDLLMEIRQHRLTPPELFPTLEGLIHAIRDGRRPPPEEETPLIERQEERIRLFDRLGAIFTSLDPAESHLFVIEDLQRAAPELIEALSIVSHRIHLLHGVEAGREPEYQPLSGQDLHGGDGNTDAHKAPRILFLATIDDQTTPPAELEACARVQCIDALSAQPHVSRVTLKSLTLSRTK